MEGRAWERGGRGLQKRGMLVVGQSGYRGALLKDCPTTDSGGMWVAFQEGGCHMRTTGASFPECWHDPAGTPLPPTPPSEGSFLAMPPTLSSLSNHTTQVVEPVTHASAILHPIPQRALVLLGQRPGQHAWGASLCHQGAVL